MSDSLEPMTRVAMVVAVLMGLPASTGDAASLPRVGAWAPAAAPAPVQAPAAPPEVVPVQRPTTTPPATTEPVVVAPPSSGEPAAAEPAEPTPTVAPVVVTPAVTVEREPEPAPVQPIVAPAYESPLVPSSDRPPPSGAGMRVGGGILIGVGAFNLLAGALVLGATNTVGDADARVLRNLSAALLIIGLVEMGTGIGLTVSGVRRAKRLRAWQSERSVAVPKSGNGLIVGGSILLGRGALDGLLVGVTASQTGRVRSFNLVFAIAEVATGAALLGVGLTRRGQYREWEHRTFMTPSLSLLPGGMAMGVSGRF